MMKNSSVKTVLNSGGLFARQVVFSAIVILVPGLAFAAGGGHGDGSIPSSIYFYGINFLIYMALLVWLLRKPVKNFYTQREAAFKQAIVKAEAARKEAEQKKREIEDRLAKLQSTADSSIAEARAEAELLRSRILADAAELSKNLREEAKRTAQLEIERARHELREEMLAQAVAVSTKLLQEKMAEPDQARLQQEFVEKIQVVR